MTSPSEGVPQTATEAQAFGWTWLNVKCLGCRHRNSIRFADLARGNANGRLAHLARRLVCSKCKSRELEFALGAYVMHSGQPWAESRQIAFDINNTVRPGRG